MDLELFVTSGLGDSTFLLQSGGEAVVVDPQRDIGRPMSGLSRSGASLRWILETHLHNDYVSGALELQAATGAAVAAPARGRYAFPHRGLAEGDEVRVGDLRLVAMETPGHTPEHLSYAVHRAGEGTPPIAVFTGGSLVVGSAGRTDLLGPDLTDRLTRAQYRSLRRLAALPDEVQVLPTHGSGSFCASGPTSRERTSTIGRERRRNPALTDRDEASFVRDRLSGLLAYPTYYAHMAPINRAGPRVVGSPPAPRPLPPGDVERLMGQGAWLVDGRPREDFARGHVPGSVNVEMGTAFASYAGWIVPFGAALGLVLPGDPPASWDEAVTELYRVGYERVEGYLEGGVEAWRAGGRPVASYPVSTIEDLCVAQRAGSVDLVLDVRQRTEWERTHLEGSAHIFVGDLPARMGEVPDDREVWAICASGQRSGIAASLLDRAGKRVRLVNGGGVKEYVAACTPEQDPAAAASGP